jgi:hypothetical protein
LQLAHAAATPEKRTRKEHVIRTKRFIVDFKTLPDDGYLCNRLMHRPIVYSPNYSFCVTLQRNILWFLHEPSTYPTIPEPAPRLAQGFRTHHEMVVREAFKDLLKVGGGREPTSHTITGTIARHTRKFMIAALFVSYRRSCDIYDGQ